LKRYDAIVIGVHQIGGSCEIFGISDAAIKLVNAINKLPTMFVFGNPMPSGILPGGKYHCLL
jgi:hypothetical protein